MWAAEIIKAAAWPIAAVLIIFRLRHAFEEAVSSIGRRKFSVELPGVKASADAIEQKQSDTPKDVSQTLTEQKLPNPNPREAARIIEETINSQLSEMEPSHRQATLTRALSIAQLEKSHEFVYNRIFGSQIEGLKRLNIHGKVTVAEAREFFSDYEKIHTEAYRNYGFHGWISFLVHNSLINKDEEVISITPFGRDFLTYLISHRLNENKPL